MHAQGQPAGYGFGKQISIQSSQVAGSTDFTNFPVLISLTDNDLRTTGNGGEVENSNVYDIIFTLGDCSTVLDHQIENYTSTSGNFVAWVRIPTLQATANTNIHMYYGNASATTDPSTTSTWNTAYDGVWHLHNDFLDASGNSKNGTNNGSSDLSTAKIADGQSFTDPNHWIELTNHPARSGDFTYSGWFRTDDRTEAGQRIFCDDASNGSGCHAISLGDPGAGRVRYYIRGLSNVSLDSPTLIANNTWYHFAASFNDATNQKTLYINGTSVGTQTANGTFGAAAGNASIGGEVASGESGNRFDGDLDEIHSTDTLLSAAWIQTEYNNQNSPSSFYTVSAEFSASGLCAALPIELLDFRGNVEGKSIKLTWTTATESNNDYFEIEKYMSDESWESIHILDGAGNSNEPLSYQAFDLSPTLGLNHYRLMQTDFDGQTSSSNMISVQFGNEMTNDELKVFPNPSNEMITVSLGDVIQSIRLFNNLGKDITDLVEIKNQSKYMSLINLSSIPDGIYRITVNEASSSLVKSSSD